MSSQIDLTIGVHFHDQEAFLLVKPFLHGIFLPFNYGSLDFDTFQIFLHKRHLPHDLKLVDHQLLFDLHNLYWTRPLSHF